MDGGVCVGVVLCVCMMMCVDDDVVWVVILLGEFNVLFPLIEALCNEATVG